METKRNWHMQVPDFRGNKTGTEINIAHVENDKRGKDAVGFQPKEAAILLNWGNQSLCEEGDAM